MLIVIALIGCGPRVGEDEIESEEVCGADGPVQLLAVETEPDYPGVPFWGSAVVGDRRVAVWYGSRSFGAYVLDACGGNEIELGERDFPLVVGDAAFVCDPMTGEIRPLDLDTGASGDVLGSGYDCNPMLRQGNAVFLRNWDTSRWGLLRPDGPLVLDVAMDPVHEAGREVGIAPYLSSWGWAATWNDEQTGRYTPWEQHSIVDKETGEVRVLPDDVMYQFGVEDGRDMFIVYEPEPDGSSRTATLSSFDATPQPGPVLSGVDGSLFGLPGVSPALLTADAIFLVDRGASIPRSPLIESLDYLMRANEDYIYQQTQDRVRVWNLDDGGLTVDFPAPGWPCSVMFPAGEALEGSFSDTMDCVEETIWSVPLDGSTPHILLETDLRFARFEDRAPMGLLAPAGDGPADLQWIDLDTDQRVTVAPDIDGLAFPTNSPLPRHAPGATDFVEYYIHQGEDAGLWLVGAPL